jgi:AcrR family transcriptional regulator
MSRVRSKVDPVRPADAGATTIQAPGPGGSNRTRSAKVNHRPAPAPDSSRVASIYREAARIICEKGYDGTSMNDIAHAVGLTKAGIYHHIPAKKDLLFQIMNYGLDELDEKVIFPARVIEDPEARLRAIVDNHVRLITSNSTPEGNNPVTVVVEEVGGLAPAHRRMINRRKRVYVDLIRGTLSELKQQDKLIEVDVTVAAFSLLGMVLWLSRWYNPGGRLNQEQVAKDVTGIALGGLLRRRPRAPSA